MWLTWAGLGCYATGTLMTFLFFCRRILSIIITMPFWHITYNDILWMLALLWTRWFNNICLCFRKTKVMYRYRWMFYFDRAFATKCCAITVQPAVCFPWLKVHICRNDRPLPLAWFMKIHMTYTYKSNLMKLNQITPWLKRRRPHLWLCFHGGEMHGSWRRHKS